MKFSMISLILLFNESLFSQTNKNFILYHQTCRQAEKYFIDSNYSQSFLTFENVFKTYDFLFPRDCFIAAQLAFKVGYDSISIEYLKKGVPFGLNAELIINSDTALFISKIRKSKYWESYKSEFPILRREYTARVDWELKKQLLQLVSIDQKWRVKNNKWFNRTFRKGLEKKFNVINRSHINFLDSVFIIKGYPGIWITGTGDSLDVAYNNNRNLSEIFFVILYHYDNAYSRYGVFLKNEIDNGHIHPRTYAMIRDFQDRFLVKREKDQKMYYNIWWEAKNFSEQEFEKHCNEIGCPTKKHLKQLSIAAGKDVDIFWWPFR